MHIREILRNRSISLAIVLLYKEQEIHFEVIVEIENNFIIIIIISGSTNNNNNTILLENEENKKERMQKRDNKYNFQKFLYNKTLSLIEKFECFHFI